MSKSQEQCQKVIKLIEKYWKTEDKGEEVLTYRRYCEMWEEVIDPKQYKADVLYNKILNKHLARYNNMKIKKKKMADYLPEQMANEEFKKKMRK